MRAARCWSSQNPGSPIAASSSAGRALRRSGSKVITDPGELGPDLLELLLQRLCGALGQFGDRLPERRPEPLLNTGETDVSPAGPHRRPLRRAALRRLVPS